MLSTRTMALQSRRRRDHVPTNSPHLLPPMGEKTASPRHKVPRVGAMVEPILPRSTTTAQRTPASADTGVPAMQTTGEQASCSARPPAGEVHRAHAAGAASGEQRCSTHSFTVDGVRFQIAGAGPFDVLQTRFLDKAAAKRKDILRKAGSRTVKLFALGILVQGNLTWDLSFDAANFRIMGILQRIAIVYGCLVVAELYGFQFLNLKIWAEAATSMDDTARNVPISDLALQLATRLRYRARLPLILLALTTLVYIVFVEFVSFGADCAPREWYGATDRNDIDTACNVASVVDTAILGGSHLYKPPAVYVCGPDKHVMYRVRTRHSWGARVSVSTVWARGWDFSTSYGELRCWQHGVGT